DLAGKRLESWQLQNDAGNPATVRGSNGRKSAAIPSIADDLHFMSVPRFRALVGRDAAFRNRLLNPSPVIVIDSRTFDYRLRCRLTKGRCQCRQVWLTKFDRARMDGSISRKCARN